MTTKIKIALLTMLMVGCSEDVAKKYKHVVSINHESKTYQVVITHQTGGDAMSRGAGGAILGGGIDMMLGGSGKGGALVGGLIGAATTSNPTTESYTEMRTDVVHTVLFDDSTEKVFKNYCPYTVGDSSQVNSINQ